MKVCSRCQIEKPLTEFYVHTKGKQLRAECSECTRAHVQHRREEHPELEERYKQEGKRKKVEERFRRANPERRALSQRKQALKRYGLTMEQYDALFELQGGKCKICGSPPDAYYKGKLAVDHDHKTGRVRGLLCIKCNKGIGCFQDDPELLIRAGRYVQAL